MCLMIMNWGVTTVTYLLISRVSVYPHPVTSQDGGFGCPFILTVYKHCSCLKDPSEADNTTSVKCHSSGYGPTLTLRV